MFQLKTQVASSKNNTSVYSSVIARGPMLDKVYSLRYKSYSEGGYISKCGSKKFMDEFDAMPNCRSYITYCNRNIIGSIRSCLLDPKDSFSHIPIMDVFKNEIKQNIGFAAPIVEANKFVIDPEFQKSGGLRARFSMFRNIVEHALESNAASIIIAVRPEHIKFYKILFFDQISKTKRYPLLNFDTVLLVCTDLVALKNRIWAKTSEVRDNHDLDYRGDQCINTCLQR